MLVTFTGYACTNCHWMKANMFPRPEIADAAKNLVLVELYTDGTDKESEENQKLQDEKFSTVAIPYYAILDPDGKVVASFGKGMTKDTQEFLAFLTARPGVIYSAKTLCTNCTAIDPSPTAEATRFTLPARISPTAKTPGKLVSSM